MAQIRRKSISKKAQNYIRYAKNKGIKLSWNNYEAMQPQDGFSRLGLICSDCLMGPCRLNPFELCESKTICGFTKEQLATKRIASLVNSKATDIDELISDITDRAVKTKHGKPYECQVGFYGLKPDQVNILIDCDDISVAETIRSEAADANVVLCGKIVEGYDSVCSYGDVEFAVLTGVVDAYITDIGLGKNAAASENVKVFLAHARSEDIINAANDHFALRTSAMDSDYLAIDSYTIRIAGTDEMKEAIEKRGEAIIVCGENNVKQTMNGLSCDTVKKALAQNRLCIVSGNAAIAAAEHGFAADKLLYAEDLSTIPFDAQAKFTVAAPEIVSKSLLEQLLIIAGKGIAVVTATELPVGGAPAVADKIGNLIHFEKAAEYTAKLDL